jgi:prepilin peptidase CpaA
MSPELIRLLVLTVFAALVIFAAFKDLVSFTIPNWISAVLALAFAPAALALGTPWPDIGLSFAVGLGVLVLGAGMFAMGWLGGGDAKLMAAAALWLGLKGVTPFFAFPVFTGLAGGALALLLLAVRSTWLRPFADTGPAWARRLATPGEAAPYGVAISVGALVAFAIQHPLV